MKEPTTVGDYRIERRLGAGPSGCVYRGRAAADGEPAAIKVMPVAGAAGSVPRIRVLAAFDGEIRTLQRTAPEGVVPVFASGHAGDDVWVATELRFEPSLAEVLEDTVLAPPAVTALGRALARTLDRCHADGIVHRSLKPANVFVTAGAPALTDFTFPGRASEAFLGSEPVPGRIPYAAPEQVLGYRQAPASNQYALAIMLYQALTGRLPFECGDSFEYLRDTVYREPGLKGVGEETRAVLTRALAKRRDDRFDSCGALAEALAEALRPGPRIVRARVKKPAGRIEAVDAAPGESASARTEEDLRTPALFSARELASPEASAPAVRALHLVRRVEPVDESLPGVLETGPVGDPAVREPSGPATRVTRSAIEILEPGQALAAGESAVEVSDVDDGSAAPPQRGRWRDWLSSLFGRRAASRTTARRHAHTSTGWRPAARSGGLPDPAPIASLPPTWRLRVVHGAAGAWVWVDGRVAGPAPAELELRARVGTRVHLEVRVRGVAVAERDVELTPMMERVWNADAD